MSYRPWVAFEANVSTIVDPDTVEKKNVIDLTCRPLKSQYLLLGRYFDGERYRCFHRLVKSQMIAEEISHALQQFAPFVNNGFESCICLNIQLGLDIDDPIDVCKSNLLNDIFDVFHVSPRKARLGFLYCGFDVRITTEHNGFYYRKHPVGLEFSESTIDDDLELVSLQCLTKEHVSVVRAPSKPMVSSSDVFRAAGMLHSDLIKFESPTHSANEENNLKNKSSSNFLDVAVEDRLRFMDSMPFLVIIASVTAISMFSTVAF